MEIKFSTLILAFVLISNQTTYAGQAKSKQIKPPSEDIPEKQPENPQKNSESKARDLTSEMSTKFAEVQKYRDDKITFKELEKSLNATYPKAMFKLFERDDGYFFYLSLEHRFCPVIKGYGTGDTMRQQISQIIIDNLNN